MAQVPGNVLDRRFFKTAQEIKSRGGAVFVRSVYLQGLLFRSAEAAGEKFAPVMAVRDKLVALSKAAGITPSELYFRYLLSKDFIDCILTGVDSVEQLQENIAVSAKGALPDDVVCEIEKIVPDLPEKYIRPAVWNTL